jgi:hypothetical protein
MPKLELTIYGIEDRWAQDNFDRIRRFNDEVPFNRFEGQHFEIELTGAVTDFEYPHNLGFQPKDIFETWHNPAGVLTWNYDKFDKDNLNLTTTGAVIVRAFIGRYEEGL